MYRMCTPHNKVPLANVALRFAGAAKIKSIVVIGGNNGQHPSKMKLYVYYTITQGKARWARCKRKLKLISSKDL